MDDTWRDNIEGIKHVHIADFLLMKEYQKELQILLFLFRYSRTNTSGAFQLMQTSLEAKLASWSR